MLYTFKQSPKDFIVNEILGYDLLGQGDFLYVYFEKTQQNTMDLITERSTHRGVERKTIGISGIKDRNAITRQRMSIPEDVIEAEGGVETIIAYLEQSIIVIEHQRHDTHLEIGRHQANQFVIALKAKKKADPAIKKLIETERQKIMTDGFPNCFGIQRFGPGNKNYHKAVELLQQAETIPDSQYVLRFIVQAYPSMLFNIYALQRRKRLSMQENQTDGTFLDGDILVSDPIPRRKEYYLYQKEQATLFDYMQCKQRSGTQLITSCSYLDVGKNNTNTEEMSEYFSTGPLFGIQTILPPEGSPAYNLEYQLYEESLCQSGKKLLKRLHLYGGRRPLVALPRDAHLERDNDDLTLSFTLPTGSYATVLLAQRFQSIDQLTCQQNRRIIPSNT